MTFLNQFLPILNSVLTIAVILGGIAVFKNTKKTGIIQIQDQTIEALQQQINALKAGQETLQKENNHLQYVIETISAALKQKGIIITVDGEMVTINDGRQSSSMRRSTKQPVKVEKDVS